MLGSCRQLAIRHFAMGMEELDEFEVLWPETRCHARELPPPPVPVQLVRPSEAPAAERSRPLDVPNPKAARACRWDGPRDADHDDGGGGKANIVPPHLLLSGRLWSETAWTLRPAGVGPAVQPCARHAPPPQLRAADDRLH
ncbi:hypothetical protein C2845_PM06G00330 [Panicum miliaceum]|uniref:Uncharacterized protein n=1 Tax=Panicum miliaceum TaxID=4540 RepID=A0A3L6R7L2_PANMI|nr:hypothetical protein C2845_PM06G00330 [Panicum miliaceum]